MKLSFLRTKLLEAKKKAVENEKKEKACLVNSKWLIVLLFGLTVLASLFFYLWTEIPQYWQRIISPVIISTLPQGAKFDPQPVLNQIEGLTQDLRGTYAFYVYRWQDGNEYGLHQEEVLTAASLIKLPVMLTVYREAERGSLNLDDYRARLEGMGKRSDNTAFNQLVDFFGEKKIQGLIDELGMKKTSLIENKTRPTDVGLLFRRLYNGEIINQENREEMLDFLTETDFEDRIPAGIPNTVQVAHKIGTEIGSFSDAGLILTEPPFILVVMSENARESEANKALPEIVKIIWEFENE